MAIAHPAVPAKPDLTVAQTGPWRLQGTPAGTFLLPVIDHLGVLSLHYTSCHHPGGV